MMEKRKHPRAACLQNCTWTMLEDGHASRIINDSPCGLMLETDQPLPPGTPVKIVRLAGQGLYCDRESACLLGIVRWSARQPNDMNACHLTGIEIVRQTAISPGI